MRQTTGNVASEVQFPIVHTYRVGRRQRTAIITQHIMPGQSKLTDPIKLRASRSIALARDGGLGDLLLLTPTLRLLADYYPDLDVHLFTSPSYICLFDHNPYVTKVHPLDHYTALAYDVALDLCQFVERSPEAQHTDRASIFARALGLELKDGTTDYFVTEDERKEAEAWVSSQGITRPWVAIAPLATDLRRSWPSPHARSFAKLLVQAGATPVFVHSSDEILQQEFPEFRYLGAVPLRIKAAVLALADVVLATDTGIYHLAAAARREHKRPFIVVLFGLVAPHLRTRWYTNILSLVAPGVPCAPCNEDLSLIPQCQSQCMTKMTPDFVFSHVKPFLRSQE